MAGKAAAVKACCYDATPFTFTDDDDPITYFGHCLRKGLLVWMRENETSMVCAMSKPPPLA